MVRAQHSCKKRTQNFAYKLTRLERFQLKSEYRASVRTAGSLEVANYDVDFSRLSSAV